jgi:hypothetical protein
MNFEVRCPTAENTVYVFHKTELQTWPEKANYEVNFTSCENIEYSQSYEDVIFTKTTEFLVQALAMTTLTAFISSEWNRRSLFRVNTLRMGLLNCLNARSRGLTFRHGA